jgi:hypothetical protein
MGFLSPPTQTRVPHTLIRRRLVSFQVPSNSQSISHSTIHAVCSGLPTASWNRAAQTFHFRIQITLLSAFSHPDDTIYVIPTAPTLHGQSLTAHILMEYREIGRKPDQNKSYFTYTDITKSQQKLLTSNLVYWIYIPENYVKTTEFRGLAALLKLAQRFHAHCSSHLQGEIEIVQYGRRDVKKAPT